MLKVKGTVVKTLKDYAMEKLDAGQLETWFNALPGYVRSSFKGPIFVSEWFEIQDYMLIPSERLAEILGLDLETMGYELGMHSAEVGLSGVYRVFLSVASPSFVIGRATSILSTYYTPAEVKVVESTSKSTVLAFSGLDPAHKILEYRVLGWAITALTKAGGKDVKGHLTGSGTGSIEIHCSWS